MNDVSNRPWREALVAFDVLGGGSLTLVAAWAWLVCEVNGGGACACLLLLLPAGAILAGSGVLIADGSREAGAAALLCKAAVAALLMVSAATHLLETGSPGWPALAAAVVIGEAAVLRP